jgi:hypothetical protein
MLVITGSLIVFLLPIVSCEETDESSSGASSLSKQEENNGQMLQGKQQQQQTKPSSSGGGGWVTSLAESINRSTKLYQDPERAKASKQQWESALKEIKNLALPKGDDKRVKEVSLLQWRMLLDEPTKVELDPETNVTTATVERKTDSINSGIKPPPRFEGFASWERMLQDWADDVQEYMDKIEAENSGYPMSSWGSVGKTADKMKPPEKQQDEYAGNDNFAQSADLNQTSTTSEKKRFKKKQPIRLPVPTAAKDGEPVVPHTDISDKSKRIWIVTTASLPWMTGTAVNPLLRAAYMTTGRKEAGGSVTLMVPWLERRQDQEQVYGANKLFESPEEQEKYIRTWLRETAKLPNASEDLNIEWYTAWQNKAENSVYSMGDITALIPETEVDICILEEPEHLNWYVIQGV